MDEKQKFVVKDDKGKEIVCEPLFTFETDDPTKQKTLKTDKSHDENGNVRVFASIYKISDKGRELLPIKTEKEWKVIETIIEAIQDESKKA